MTAEEAIEKVRTNVLRCEAAIHGPNTSIMGCIHTPKCLDRLIAAAAWEALEWAAANQGPMLSLSAETAKRKVMGEE